MFVARTVYGLPYRREREGALDRSHTRQRRPYAKQGGEYRMFEDPPLCRPKGMHRRSYEWLAAAIYAAMNHHDEIWLAGNSRLIEVLKQGRSG